MKLFIVVSCVFAVVAAEPPVRASYGAPSSGGYSGGNGGGGSGGFGSGGIGGFNGGGGGGGGGFGGGNGGGFGGGGQVRRYVSIHVAPDEPEDNQNRVIRVPGGQDKHVNIIFVKAPSHSSQQNTEVILPEQSEQKTLVYVLVKRPENTADVKIRAPAPSRPAKPEVFFIRYKNNGGGGGGNGGGLGGGNGLGGGLGGGSSGGSGAYGAPAPVQVSAGGYN